MTQRVMKVRSRWVFGVILVLITACNLKEDGLGINLLSVTYDFSESEHGWQHGFSDYPAGPDDSSFYELQYAYKEAPDGANAIMLSGNNHSDDLFMYLKKKVTGLRSDEKYTLTFDVELASNAPSGSVGIGGAPGESVFLKVGATTIEPQRINERGYYLMNIDKGNQLESGADMIYVGNIATLQTTTEYALINRSNAAIKDTPLEVRSNNKGEIWLIVGTDSGFEGITTLYYTKVNVVLSSSN